MPTGLEDWFMNFTHVVRSAVTSESLANIPRPYSELAIFGIFKGGEIASFIGLFKRKLYVFILGGCLVHPIYRFILIKRLTSETTTNNSYKIIRARCRKLQGRFLIGGLLIGPVASMIYASKHTASDVKQICYKIRCDDKNMTLDRTSLAFGLVGWYWKRFQGAVDGVNIALAYCLLLLAVNLSLLFTENF
uniref:Mito carr domain containing protein n=1 Tax=Syphacia muris TaxID=451379 RepID=A0A0N5AZA4_9BILA